MGSGDGAEDKDTLGMLAKIEVAVPKFLNQQGFQVYRADSISPRVGNARARIEISSKKRSVLVSKMRGNCLGPSYQSFRVSSGQVPSSRQRKAIWPAESG